MTVFHKTDFVDLDTRIVLSYGAKYGTRPSLRARVELNHKITELALPVLKKILNLPEKLWVRVCFLKAKRLSGRYWDYCTAAEVDARLEPGTFLEVLCHELVHAEQYTTGRLSWKTHGRRNVNYWDGVPVIIEYREQPWEIEAFRRQKDLADYVMKNDPEINKLLTVA